MILYFKGEKETSSVGPGQEAEGRDGEEEEGRGWFLYVLVLWRRAGNHWLQRKCVVLVVKPSGPLLIFCCSRWVYDRAGEGVKGYL